MKYCSLYAPHYGQRSSVKHISNQLVIANFSINTLCARICRLPSPAHRSVDKSLVLKIEHASLLQELVSALESLLWLVRDSEETQGGPIDDAQLDHKSQRWIDLDDMREVLSQQFQRNSDEQELPGPLLAVAGELTRDTARVIRELRERLRLAQVGMAQQGATLASMQQGEWSRQTQHIPMAQP